MTAVCRSVRKLVHIPLSIEALSNISRPALQSAIHTDNLKLRKTSRVSKDNRNDFRLEIAAQNILKVGQRNSEKIVLIDEDGREFIGVTFHQATDKLRKGRTELKFVENRMKEEDADPEAAAMRVFVIKKVQPQPKTFQMSTKIENADLEVKCRPMIKHLQESGAVFVRLRVRRGFEPDSLKPRLTKVIEDLLGKPVTVHTNGVAILHVKMKIEDS